MKTELQHWILVRLQSPPRVRRLFQEKGETHDDLSLW